jgi:uncharacterized membrane protein YjjP (DUF1212 family)
MLASGAQAREAESGLLVAMQGLALEGADAIVTNSAVTVSHLAPGDAETTTAIQAVRDWRPDFGKLAAAAALVAALRDGRSDLKAAEAELDRIEAMQPPYPSWFRFVAPALLSAAVTVMFGGTVLDSIVTFAIGLAIQPALEGIERGSLPLFFQVVFGVAATAILVVLLAGLGLPIDGGLVLTGSLLRFLPGAQLVAGMRDLIAGATVSGAANLAEVILLGVAIAGSASLVLAVGQTLFDVQLAISVEGGSAWPAIVIILAGAVAVAAYSVRIGVPARVVGSAAALGALAVLVANGFAPGFDDLDRNARTLVAALLIGVLGRLLAGRFETPSALWIVPAILPLLPAPATLLPLLAPSDEVRQLLQGQALTTAFLIGVGVATGDILAGTYQRYRGRARTAPA